MLSFPTFILAVNRGSFFSTLIKWPKRVACHRLVSLIEGGVLCDCFKTVSLHFISARAVRSILLKDHIYTSCFDSPLYLILRLTRPHTHRSKWVQYCFFVLKATWFLRQPLRSYMVRTRDKASALYYNF